MLYSIDECSLDPKRIDLWLFDLSQDSAQARTLLNSTELERADRFHFPIHRKRFTNGRAFLRSMLGRYLEQDPKSLSFLYGKQGKPELKNNIGLQFNLSHSEDLALLAIGQQYALGVDLEWYSARPYFGIARQVFSEKEQVHLKQLPKKLRAFAFFHVWAKKEALMKASGLGFSYPCQEIDLHLLHPGLETIFDPQTKQNWKIEPFMPKIACSAAVCYHPDVTVLRYQVFNERV